jgi:fructokinase
MNTRQFSHQDSEEADGDTSGRRAILIFGEILADMFPERSVLGGAPFNVARHLAAFGMSPLMVSRVGTDALGERIGAEMAADGMDTTGVQSDPGRPTGRVRVHMQEGGHSFEILPDQAYDHIDPEAARAAAVAANPTLVYFGSLIQRGDVSRTALREILAATSCPRFVDLNLREPWFSESTVRFSLHGADILKINNEELDALAAMLRVAAQSPEDRARALLRDFSISRIIVTCAGEGAWQVEAGGGAPVSVPGRQTDVVDTVGAGDGFASVCILGLLSGWEPGPTLERANAFAAAVCGIRGAAPDDAGFYHPFFQEWTS